MKKVKILIICFIFFIGIIKGNGASLNTSALWRSAIFAGWGQKYFSYNLKGYIFMGSELLLLSGSVATYIIQEKAYDDYQKATSDFDNYWDTYENRLLLCRVMIGVTGAFYLYNLIDAAFFTKNKNIAYNNYSFNLKMYAWKGPIYDLSISRRF